MKIDLRISCLRISATLAVIWLHTCSTIMENFEVTSNQAVFLNSCHDLVNWAVPVFFMITGALFLQPEKKLTIYQAATQYCRRILLALLIFGIPFSLMKLVAAQKAICFSQIPNALLSIAQGNSFSHLWYLYELIGLYLILPILKSYLSDTSDKELGLLLLVLFVFDSVIPTIVALTGMHISLTIPLTYPVFYLTLGHVLMQHPVPRKRFLFWGGVGGINARFFRMRRLLRQRVERILQPGDRAALNCRFLHVFILASNR